MNATHRASMPRCFHKMLDHQKFKSNKHNDLHISGVKIDTEDVYKVVEILSDIFISPFTDSHLVCILNRLAATEEEWESLMNVKPMPRTQYNVHEGKIGRKSNNWFFSNIEETGVEDVLKSAKSCECWCERSHGAFKNTSTFVWSYGYNNAPSHCRPEKSF